MTNGSKKFLPSTTWDQMDLETCTIFFRFLRLLWLWLSYSGSSTAVTLPPNYINDEPDRGARAAPRARTLLDPLSEPMLGRQRIAARSAAARSTATSAQRCTAHSHVERGWRKVFLRNELVREHAVDAFTRHRANSRVCESERALEPHGAGLGVVLLYARRTNICLASRDLNAVSCTPRIVSAQALRRVTRELHASVV